MKTRMCIVEKEVYVGEYEQSLIIRRIHRIGKKLWLGKPMQIKSFYYDHVDDNKGPVSIMTSDYEYIVPREYDSTSEYRITIADKRIYDIKEGDILHEIVIKDNKPMLQDYSLEGHNLVSDMEPGIQGFFGTEKGEVVIL